MINICRVDRLPCALYGIKHWCIITCCISRGVKHELNQVQRKLIDSHKLCLKFLPQVCWSLVNYVINLQLLQAVPYMQ